MFILEEMFRIFDKPFCLGDSSGTQFCDRATLVIRR